MHPASAIPPSEAALWGRLLEPAEAVLTPEAAHHVIGLRFPQEDVDRMQVLAGKARAGELTADERHETEIYERVGHALSLMKSRARAALG